MSLAARSIPNYELYGELLAGSYTDPVHHETIRERSSKHDWTIGIHRHTALAQLFLFRTPGVYLRLGNFEHLSREPLILVAPPGVPHGFRFSENVVGDVLSLRVNELEGDTVDRIVAWQGAGGGILTQGTSRHFGDVQTLVAQLAATYHGLEPERRPLLKALTQLIVVYVSSDLQRKNPVGAVPDSLQPTRHEDQAERFCKLVEANFQSPWTVADYAKAAGVSTPHLTRVCRRVLGVSPNELVRQRRLLEARRLLEYTRLPIAEVAHNSGFRDPAFFSRTFKRDVGSAPQDYRKAHT